MDKVVTAKVAILRSLPYLIFGTKLADLEQFLDPYSAVPDGRVGDLPTISDRIDESQPVSSVYLDNQSGYCYDQRIMRREGAELIRFRWYGHNIGDDETPIFVERKIHHDSWTGEESSKERFCIPQKKVFPFMKGTLTIDEYVNDLAKKTGASLHGKKLWHMLKLGREVQKEILSKNLQPMVRTSYLRAAFQASDTNSVRISLDTNLCMVDEFMAGGHPHAPWCRVAEDLLGKNQVVRFPMAVLEVKLQTEQPPWVTRMLAECGAIMLYKFSKYQHGMAYLHRDRISQLPHWLDDLEQRGLLAGFSAPRSLNLYNSSGSAIGYCGAQTPGHLMISSCGGQSMLRRRNSVERLLPHPRGARELEVSGMIMSDDECARRVLERSRNVKRLDPKSFFAAERTFLHYVQKALYLGGLSVALLTIHHGKSNSNMQRRAGMMLSPISIFLLLYAYIIYRDRSDKINRRLTGGLWRAQMGDKRSERLDNKWGPIVVFVVLAFVVTLAIAMSVEDVPVKIKKNFTSLEQHDELSQDDTTAKSPG
eukprot:GHVS01091226.1.p1 GENE.GHVS01091226.1~~GHVS01091226.1.p1  ORF type:complete len:536 (-),score=76.79 GHVS01091226.1:1020-2627(-)